jgi:hypothetical protein
LLKPLVGTKFEIVDLNKSALILNELHLLSSNFDFVGLSFFENNKDYLKNTREAIIKKVTIFLQYIN